MKVSHYNIFMTADVPGGIANGWQPWGSPFVTPNGAVLQAMVKWESLSNMNPAQTVVAGTISPDMTMGQPSALDVVDIPKARVVSQSKE